MCGGEEGVYVWYDASACASEYAAFGAWAAAYSGTWEVVVLSGEEGAAEDEAVLVLADSYWLAGEYVEVSVGCDYEAAVWAGGFEWDASDEV